LNIHPAYKYLWYNQDVTANDTGGKDMSVKEIYPMENRQSIASDKVNTTDI